MLFAARKQRGECRGGVMTGMQREHEYLRTESRRQIIESLPIPPRLVAYATCCTETVAIEQVSDYQKSEHHCSSPSDGDRPKEFFKRITQPKNYL